MTARARNLLFLFSDQHAQRVAGCYGDPHVSTPALDRLAASGVRFDNAYCPSPICVASRMSMLTARHPSRQDCWTNDDHLASDIPTWLHALGAAGHRPELVGRLHAIGPDQTHGYAARQVGEHSPNWPGVPFHDLGALAGTNNPDPRSLAACGAGRSAYEAKDRDVTEAALATLDRIAEAGAPFCLTVGLMLPHAPYVAARRWIQHYLEVLPPPEIPADACDHPWIAWWRANRGIDDVPDRQSRLARAAYWGLVSTMDEMIGRILDRLRALGLDRDTLVVYASDHGDHAGERGLWWKHTLFDESAKVPMILSLPGVLPENAARDEVVSLIDLSQTMIEALGGAPLRGADGRSFWPLLTGASRDWDDTIFCEYCTDPVPDWTGGRAVQHRMVRQGRWKLHVYASDPPLLFDLETDPQERNDLSRDPRHAERFKRLMALALDGWDPVLIARRMAQRRAEKDVLAAWAGRVGPPSTHMWALDPDMNRLEADR
ncbi:sulfatase-like hydrolase/transferase [Rhodobacteraceae bacterium 2CG4]|uniref:Sulfatase-like hydrolase/transferase n=1 Tax=Halovulum marinum TaxID=2662447 RepID=A0A6L5YWM0_9RHOB|nr:sulfatase-like hydrolase/transferase [Halovulum marinum]MSU88701.1 sulfatase-like hydrolase/transferase [Halovulum marinum]